MDSEEQTEEYDTSLTEAHTYLGEGLENMRGRTILDDTVTHQMLVLAGRNVTLIPGETLPLLLHHNEEVRPWLKTHKVFGILYPRQTVYGTTADLRSFKEEQSHDGYWTLTVKAEGSQRFKVIEKRIISQVIFMAEVRILPDRRLLPPEQHLLLEGNRLRNVMGKLTPFPQWVYNQCHERILMKELSEVMKSILGKDPPVKDPTAFSYWVVANVPINEGDRKVLLALNSSQERLFMAKHYLKLNCKICCAECLSEISTKDHMFSMSTSGAQGTFVNMAGYIHEMLTVRLVDGVSYVGASSEHYSWFPGYAWHIIECAECGMHVGWRFSTQKNLQPQKFWGLSRGSVRFAPIDNMSQLDKDVFMATAQMSRAYLDSTPETYETPPDL
ncbi:protein cereblon [Galendromus occidentalis]|uniref:Protein cereblon n=1 Tax=Galendromus occidentalis TaxID=34638 RepID=A0AAJ6W0P5_9ACAR|nr:protein cereblon [Galendromus occidentalis]